MFGIWGRQKKIDRTIRAIQEMADSFERGDTGLIAAAMANADLSDDDPDAPSPEQIRRINFELLAACYMLHCVKKSASQKDFYKLQEIIADAVCVMREVQKRQHREMHSAFLQHYQAWEPYLKSEDTVDEAMELRAPF